MPIVLGSVVAVIPMLFPVGLFYGLENEEALRIMNYLATRSINKKTKYRLIPYIW